MYIQLLFSTANTCNTLNVNNGGVTTGSNGDPTGTSYVATCNDGFSVSSSTSLTGTLVCDSSNAWSNQPECVGT